MSEVSPALDMFLQLQQEQPQRSHESWQSQESVIPLLPRGLEEISKEERWSCDLKDCIRWGDWMVF